MSLGYGVVQLDVTIVNTALEQHRRLARRRRRRAAMGRERLHDRVRRLHPHRGRARRPARRQAGLHGGLCHLHRGLARLRAGAERRDPDRRALRCRDWRRPSWCRIRWRCSTTPMPIRRRAAAPSGIWAAGASLALTAGPFVGGALIALVGWRCDLPGQSADRARRALAGLALCQETPRQRRARARPAGPGRGDRRARHACRRR